jgi:polyphosphate kinase
MDKSLSQTTSADPASDFLDRDLSILAFNERVLDWAHRPEVPVLERLRYLCIVSLRCGPSLM